MKISWLHEGIFDFTQAVHYKCVHIYKYTSIWRHCENITQSHRPQHIMKELTLRVGYGVYSIRSKCSQSWWRHQMETFTASLAICAGNSPVPGEFPAQRPMTRSFDIFFDLRLNNDWVNNRDVGDLRRYRAHCDVIVMVKPLSLMCCMQYHRAIVDRYILRIYRLLSARLQWWSAMQFRDWNKNINSAIWSAGHQ